VSVSTGYCGSISDNAIKKSVLFNHVCCDENQEQVNTFALGDPGYNGVKFLVSGYNSNELNSEERRTFDKESRQEQKIAEWINNY